MIIQFIITSFLGLLSFIFSLFTLPALPLAITQGIAGGIQFLSIPIGIVRNYVGDSFLSAVIYLSILFLTLVPTLKIAIFIYNKVRGSGD